MMEALERQVVAALKERGMTLALAESCTGGLAAKRLTDVPGASAVFLGGVVSYTNGVKERVLGVPHGGGRPPPDGGGVRCVRHRCGRA